jgi:hypothetical protein
MLQSPSFSSCTGLSFSKVPSGKLTHLSLAKNLDRRRKDHQGKLLHLIIRTKLVHATQLRIPKMLREVKRPNGLGRTVSRRSAGHGLL